MTLTVCLRISRWRRYFFRASKLALIVLIGFIVWQSFTQWWGDYIWLYPLLLGGAWIVGMLTGTASRPYPELSCWEGLPGASSQGEKRVVLRCREGDMPRKRGQSGLSERNDEYIQVRGGFLLPWLVIFHVRPAGACNKLVWCWVYRDQVDKTGWARLRRIARQSSSIHQTA